jgi:hypothetical protein
MSGRGVTTAGLLLLLGTHAPGHAGQIWAIWDLDLGAHAPPTSFILTVTSLNGAGVPPPLTVPYGACTAVPNVARGSYCAPVGCPPVGTYTFVVQAQYAEGLSAPSNLATCMMSPLAVCTCVTDVPAPAPPPAPPPPSTVPALPPLPVLVTTPPPLPQTGPDGLNLQPIGELPPLPSVPPLPPMAAT